MASEAIENTLGSVENLPTLPMVLRQINKVMNNPNSNMASIAAVVAKDQSLASRTIRLVNSAYYARRNRIPSIQQAIVVLGLNTLHNLMLGLSVVKMFKSSSPFGFDLAAFWQHSFAVALLSKKLASRAEKGALDPEECFIAGLLHDMGRLALQQYMHAEYEEALKKALVEQAPLHEAERNLFKFDHAEAGEWLGQRWGLQAKLIGAIACHHRSFAVPGQYSAYEPVIHVVAYANELCIDEEIGGSGEAVVRVDRHPGLPAPEDGATRRMVNETAAEVISVVEEWTKEGAA